MSRPGALPGGVVELLGCEVPKTREHSEAWSVPPLPRHQPARVHQGLEQRDGVWSELEEQGVGRSNRNISSNHR